MQLFLPSSFFFLFFGLIDLLVELKENGEGYWANGARILDPIPTNPLPLGSREVPFELQLIGDSP